MQEEFPVGAENVKAGMVTELETAERIAKVQRLSRLGLVSGHWSMLRPLCTHYVDVYVFIWSCI